GPIVLCQTQTASHQTNTVRNDQSFRLFGGTTFRQSGRTPVAVAGAKLHHHNNQRCICRSNFDPNGNDQLITYEGELKS
ncbi:MAG TPA: hypothetical protein VIV66_18390, partial [Pyrinomonadaceae bacterium]